MINFFRKTRRKLADDNKFFKYSRYAIGEIVLVVIGILIALQINNANQLRKEKLKSDVYTDKIIKDLEADTLNLNYLIGHSQMLMHSTKSYFDYYEKSKVPVEELIDSARSIPIKTQLRRYLPINHTFKEMRASGNLSLLEDEQKSKLIELTNLQEFYQIIIEKKITMLLDELLENEKYMDSGWAKTDFFEKFGVPQSHKTKIQGLFHRHNVLWLFYDLAGDYHDTSIEVKTKTIEVLEFLKQESD